LPFFVIDIAVRIHGYSFVKTMTKKISSRPQAEYKTNPNLENTPSYIACSASGS
jgi:hypothetical protein